MDESYRPIEDVIGVRLVLWDVNNKSMVDSPNKYVTRLFSFKDFSFMGLKPC